MLKNFILFTQLLDLVLDGMHNIGGGASRRLFECLFRSISRAKANLAILTIQANRAMTKANQYLYEWKKVYEFVREVRPFNEMHNWKMREGHEALIYHLIPLLAVPEIRVNVGEPSCDAAMCLVIGLQLIYHTSHESPSAWDIDEAEIQIKTFFKKFLSIYQKDVVSYKMHCLVHLPNECRLRGAHLGSFDCYPFENWLGRIKDGLVMTGKGVVKQFINNLAVHAENILPTDLADGLVSRHRLDFDAVVDQMVIHRSLNLPPTSVHHFDVKAQKVVCQGFIVTAKFVILFLLESFVAFMT